MEAKRSAWARAGRVGGGVALFLAGFALAFVFVGVRRSREGPKGEPTSRSPAGEATEARSEKSAASPEARFEAAFQGLASALEDREPRGEISGIVLTPDGSPVSGVYVHCSPRQNRPHRPWEELSLEERALKIVTDVSDRAWARTDATGTFRLEGLPKQWTYTVSAEHYGYRISPVSGVRPGGVKVGARVVFAAERVLDFGVRLACVLPDGSQPREVDLRLECPGCKTYLHWLLEDPVIWAPEPVVRLRADFRGEGLEYSSGEMEVSLGKADALPSVTILLKSVPGIRGTIRYPHGQVPAWRDPDIFAVPVDEPKRIPHERLSSPLEPRGHVFRRSAEEFDYGFRNLPSGLYWVFVPYGWETAHVAAEAFVRVGDAMVVQDLEVQPVPPEISVRLRARGPRGAALDELSVSFLRPGKEWASPWLFQEDLNLWIVVLPAGMFQEPEGPWTLRVTSRLYGIAEVPYDPAKHAEVAVEFPEPTFLVVEVADWIEHPCSRGAIVLALLGPLESSAAAPPDEGIASQTVERPGRAVFAGVPPGQYELSVRLAPWLIANARGGGREIQRIPVMLVPGLNRTVVRLPELFDVAIRIPFAAGVAGLSVFTRDEAVGCGRWIARWSERAIFPGLPAGAYLVRDDRGREMEFDLPGPLELEFRPEVRRRWGLEVRISDPDGYLARAGFRSGDWIAEVKGERFGSLEDIQCALAAALEEQSVAVEVLRGEETVRITVDPKELVRPRALGGRLVPGRR